MRTGIVFSALLHVVAFALGYLAWPALRREMDAPDPQILEVELVSIDSVNRVPAELVREEPSPPTPEPKPEPEPQPQPPPEPAPVKLAEASLPPPLEPPPVEKPALKPPQKEALKPAPKPIAQPKAKPKPPQRFDADRVAALIDKSLKAQAQSQPAQQDKLAAAVRASQPASLDGKRLTATLAAVLKAQVTRCWALDPGMRDIDNMQVQILVQFNEDGTIIGMPQIAPAFQQRFNDPAQAPFRVFAESARRAVQRCAPYDLPREMYAEWRNVQLNFDPREVIN
jgi:outer membrane biosynthesis protein TonB